MRPLEQSDSQSLCDWGCSGPARSAALHPTSAVEAMNRAAIKSDLASLIVFFMDIIMVWLKGWHRYTRDTKVYSSPVMLRKQGRA